MILPNMARKGTPITVLVGRRIESARLQAGYQTMREFAAVLGVSEQRYRRYEAGEVQAPYEILIRIADLSGSSCDFLLRNVVNRPLLNATTTAAVKKN